MNSGVFGDPCPNTHKYVEVHYACSPNGEANSGGRISTRRPPPWLLEGTLWNTDPEGDGLVDPNTGIPIEIDEDEDDDRRTRIRQPPTLIESHPEEDLSGLPDTPNRRRKPILVATEVIEDGKAAKSGSNPRIPITTPKPILTTTTITTSAAASASTSKNDDQNVPNEPFSNGDDNVKSPANEENKFREAEGKRSIKEMCLFRGQ